MGPEMGLEVGRRPSGCPATRPRHARTLTGHGRHKFGRFSSWPGPASRSIKLKNVLRTEMFIGHPNYYLDQINSPNYRLGYRTLLYAELL